MKYVPQTLIGLATLSLLLAIVATLTRDPIAGLNISTYLHACTNLAILAIIYCLCFKVVLVQVRGDESKRPGQVAIVLAGLTVLAFVLAVLTKLAGTPFVGMKAHALYLVSVNFGLITIAYCLCEGLKVRVLEKVTGTVV